MINCMHITPETEVPASRRIAHPLGFSTAGLSFGQIAGLVDALTTVGNVLAGLVEQPRFSKDGELNDAGSLLEGFCDSVFGEIGAIRAEVDRRTVKNSSEGGYKFSILARGCAGGGDDASAAIAELMKIVAGIDADLRKAGAQ